MSGVLEAATSTNLGRTTVHAQYNGKALGVVMLNTLIPIVLKIVVPGACAKPVILLFGDRAHKYSPYQDYGVRNLCCRRVLTFNIHHYVKCYLTSGTTEDDPYTYNCCNRCGAVVKDGCNHLLQVNARRSYRPDKYIYKASGILQSDNNPELFNYQRGNC